MASSGASLLGATGPQAAIAAGIATLVINSDKLPEQISGLLSNLATGLLEGIPKLIDYLAGPFIEEFLTEFVPSIVQALASILPKLIEASIKAAVSIVKSIPKTIAGVFKSVGKGIVDGIKGIGKLFGFGRDRRSPQQKLNDTVKKLSGLFKELEASLRETAKNLRFNLASTQGKADIREGEIDALLRQRSRLESQFNSLGRRGKVQDAAVVAQKIAEIQEQLLNKSAELTQLQNQALDEQLQKQKELTDLKIREFEESKRAAEQLISQYSSLKDAATGAFDNVRQAIIGNQLGAQGNLDRLQSAFDAANSPEARSAAAQALAGGLQTRLQQAQALAASGAITGEEFARIQDQLLAQLEKADGEIVSEFDQMIAVQQKIVDKADEQIKVYSEGLARLEEAVEEQKQSNTENLQEMINILDDIRLGGRNSSGSFKQDYEQNKGNIRGRING